MLPLQQAYEVKYAILEYLRATFTFKDRKVAAAFDGFIHHPEEGIFKGPYLSLKLPFVKAGEGEDIPLSIRPPFPPYHHQATAFRRLTTADGHKPESTLITTGTSSGKTECFLYPVLDYCYRHIGRPGIKVIILYPMNALASDQAKRLAKSIWEDERLKGKVTAGLFIGEGREKKKFPAEMGADHIIENRETILAAPPDILLTNFKMLDYALMRNTYHSLWGHNLGDPALLQYLVLDELHTYDGAQGTDVANLIRRLKLKLGIPAGQLCAVGTSATISAGEGAEGGLIRYAEKVFGESFSPGAVIGEHRLSVEDVFGPGTLEPYIPRVVALRESRLGGDETYAGYIARQKRLWQIPEGTDAFALGAELKKLQLVHDLLTITGHRIVRLDEALRVLADTNQHFGRLPEWDDAEALNPREEVLHSLLALVSEARTGSPAQSFPFLYLQVQIWIRELSGILRELGGEPKFVWKEEVEKGGEAAALPAYFCRECGASGWLGVKDDNKNHFFTDPKQVYEYYFANHKNVYFLNTADHRHIEEYEPTTQITDYIDTLDGSLHEGPREGTVRIHAVRKLAATKSRPICPECATENNLAIIGTRVATLSSITVSQVLSSDLDPRPERERKILAFTNSVQDAAHQAGFVEARNYRFTFRASLQKVINSHLESMSLPELMRRFTDYWKGASDPTGGGAEEAYYYRFFPADYHGKVDIDTDYRDAGKKRFTEAFRKEFDLRMSWEILSEFGYNASIGRTLEKTGASGAKWNETRLAQVFALMKDWLNGAGGLPMIDEESLLPFINGILHRIRTRGGVAHEYLAKFRGSNSLWDLNWQRDNRHFLNRMFHSRARFPKLVTTSGFTGKGVMDTTATRGNNWFRAYFTRSFLAAPNDAARVAEFYKELFAALATAGILNEGGEGEALNYAIAPEAILVEKGVATHICDTCGGRLYVALSDTLSQRTACLDYACTGTYTTREQARPNYYQLVYNRERSPRIYATEHTGILERKDRENKEIDFKERPAFNSLNAIVATSTLEMGIDIGTLNAAINNSVPPLPGNYLQRIGRAGRASGSALITNFAQSKAHDLYYYAQPADMMEGDVATPGCFLEAGEILARHFFAYCLDCWAADDPRANGIPGVLLTMKLQRTDLAGPDTFPSRITAFIKAREEELYNSFAVPYERELAGSGVLQALKATIESGSLYRRLMAVFVKLKEEYRYIADTIAHLDEAIKALPQDEERRDLEREKSSLRGLKRGLDKRSVLEHLTNVGLLPNYAFPETGVTLNASIRPNIAKGSEGIPTDRQFEIVRPSRTAIRELAPDNFFYSQGYKFAIAGLNTYDWREPGIVQEKRFCSLCDHIADKALSPEPICPKCGDTSWSSEKNHHRVVKLTGVKSADYRDRSTLDDSSDEREMGRYRISRHISFDTKAFQGAWGMKEIPFGIEYVKNVKMMEVNLGLKSAVDAAKVTINGVEEVPAHGFVTCRICGKSTANPATWKVAKDFHFGYCRQRTRVYDGKADDVFEQVYLFRELATEALKILLPVQEFESEATVNMFKAGLELGLKKYYDGNPQHLGITDYAEYNAKNNRFDQYLVLYDSIPGGTGYLEKLFHPEAFTALITRAYEGIRDCVCKAKGKDGCYRCIYTYANAANRDELSRERAEELFKRIVDKSADWERFSTGLGALTSDGNIEESELEERFVRSLRKYAAATKGIGNRFEDFLEEGVKCYKMRLMHGDAAYNYAIRPQYDLGPAQGVAHPTRADFFITLTGAEQDGQPLADAAAVARPVAIYLDGYTYHATKEYCRFYDDLKKRAAIVASGAMLSWTLTWADMERFDAVEAEGEVAGRAAKRDGLWLDRAKYAAAWSTYQRMPYWNKYKSKLLEARNSLERLIWHLQHPLNSETRTRKVALALTLRQTAVGKPSVNDSDIDAVLRAPFEPLAADIEATQKAAGAFYVLPEMGAASDFAALRTGIKVSDLSMKSAAATQAFPEDFDKGSWEAFWGSWNLVQDGCIVPGHDD